MVLRLKCFNIKECSFAQHPKLAEQLLEIHQDEETIAAFVNNHITTCPGPVIMVKEGGESVIYQPGMIRKMAPEYSNGLG